jgi:glycosyltransferase involved in cell wall biosynthesis
LKSGLGIICNPMDAENIAEKIKFLIENKNELNKLYKADLDFIKNNFSPQILTKQLADIFKKELE